MKTCKSYTENVVLPKTNGFEDLKMKKIALAMTVAMLSATAFAADEKPLALIGGVKGAVITTVVVAGVAVAAGNNGSSNTSGTTK
ncbi:MAG: hypothetical protein V4688_04585 [Pseudomonadota bacterium]